MIRLTFPDNSVREFAPGITGREEHVDEDIVELGHEGGEGAPPAHGADLIWAMRGETPGGLMAGEAVERDASSGHHGVAGLCVRRGCEGREGGAGWRLVQSRIASLRRGWGCLPYNAQRAPGLRQIRPPFPAAGGWASP